MQISSCCAGTPSFFFFFNFAQGQNGFHFRSGVYFLISLASSLTWALPAPLWTSCGRYRNISKADARFLTASGLVGTAPVHLSPLNPPPPTLAQVVHRMTCGKQQPRCHPWQCLRWRPHSFFSTTELEGFGFSRVKTETFHWILTSFPLPWLRGQEGPIHGLSLGNQILL